MKKHIVSGACFAVVQDNQILLYSATGQEIIAQIRCKITDAVGEPATFVMSGICNIVSSVEEMRNIISERSETV